MNSPPIFTIGYAQRSVGDLIKLVKDHSVEFVIDVRSAPVSRFQPEFSRDQLKVSLKNAGLRYLFLGHALGGRPADRSCYSSEGYVIYEFVEQREFFCAGIARLRKAVRDGHHVCLLCAERKPEDCHRSKLIGAALHRAGLEVLHIDANGETISQGVALARLVGPQGELFGPGLRSRKSYDKDQAKRASNEP